MCIYLSKDPSRQTFPCEGTKSCWLRHSTATWLGNTCFTPVLALDFSCTVDVILFYWSVQASLWRVYLVSEHQGTIGQVNKK